MRVREPMARSAVSGPRCRRQRRRASSARTSTGTTCTASNVYVDADQLRDVVARREEKAGAVGALDHDVA